jgi:5'-nucleotidase
MLSPADSLPVKHSLAAGSFWNVNFPHLAPGPLTLPPVVTCQPARSPLNVSFTQKGNSFLYDASYAARPQDAGSDVEACFSGRVAVTLLSI